MKETKYYWAEWTALSKRAGYCVVEVTKDANETYMVAGDGDNYYVFSDEVTLLNEIPPPNSRT